MAQQFGVARVLLGALPALRDDALLLRYARCPTALATSCQANPARQPALHLAGRNHPRTALTPSL